MATRHSKLRASDLSSGFPWGAFFAANKFRIIGTKLSQWVEARG
jgi:hypothetical protein